MAFSFSGEVQKSMYPGRVIVEAPKEAVQPRITVDKYNARRIVLGDDVTLPCVAQGHPVPSYYWKRELQGQPVPVALGERLSMLSAGLLKIAKVRLHYKQGMHLTAEIYCLQLFLIHKLLWFAVWKV